MGGRHFFAGVAEARRYILDYEKTAGVAFRARGMGTRVRDSAANCRNRLSRMRLRHGKRQKAKKDIAFGEYAMAYVTAISRRLRQGDRFVIGQ